MSKKNLNKKQSEKSEKKIIVSEVEEYSPVKPVNSQFETKLAEVAGQPVVDAEKKDGRGGARPGAGRPLGTPDDLMRINRLPMVLNRMLVPVIEIPFDLWAKSQGISELALTKGEAESLALPVTQLLEWYFPGKIPEIVFVWLCLLGTSKNIFAPRLKLLAEKRAAKKTDVVSARGNPAAGTVPTGPLPAASYPKVG